ncbi:MAG: hypothetical protein KGJ07_06925, partial [Patescibacteria group bacterium]|nr:hypothetical protein [Patescibacteria group bacterium]
TPVPPALPGVTNAEQGRFTANTTNQLPAQPVGSKNIQVSTTQEKTDAGFITSTTTIIRDPKTGQITNAQTQQTMSKTTSTYTNTPNGIVRTDTTVTTDANTGKVVSTKTSDTQVTKLTPVIVPGNLPPFPTFGGTTETPKAPTTTGQGTVINPKLPVTSQTANQQSNDALTQTFVNIGTSVGKVATDVAHALGVTLPQTIISSFTGQPPPTQTSVSSNENVANTQTSSPDLFQTIASWFTGNPSNTNATINAPVAAPNQTNTVGVTSTANLNSTNTTNTVQQPSVAKPVLPQSSQNQTTSNQSPNTANLSPDQSMVQFAQSKTSQCYQGYAGYYNACIGSPYHGTTLEPGMTINPLFGGNPEGNPNSLYFCTTLVIDAAKSIGVNLPNSTGALQMYQNFTNENAIILSENANLNSSSPLIKPGMAAFVNKPTGDANTPYNVGHVGLVESVFYDSSGVLNVKILQTNADSTEAVYKLDSQGRLYNIVHGVPYYIRGFGDIQSYAQATGQPIKNTPTGSGSSSTQPTQQAAPTGGSLQTGLQTINSSHPTFYSQVDPKWSSAIPTGPSASVADDTCGIFVIANLTQTSPATVWQNMHATTGLNNITAAGLSTDQILNQLTNVYHYNPVTISGNDIVGQIKQYTDQGIPVYMSTPKMKIPGAGTPGHHDMIVGVDANGNLITNDSAYLNGQNKTIPISNVLDQRAWRIFAVYPPNKP